MNIHPPSKIKIPTGTKWYPNDSMMIFPFRDFLQLLGDRPQAIDPVISLISLWGGDLVYRIHPNTSLHKGPEICLHGGKMYPGSNNHRFLQVFSCKLHHLSENKSFHHHPEGSPPIICLPFLPCNHVSNRTSYLSNSSPISTEPWLWEKESWWLTFRALDTFWSWPSSPPFFGPWTTLSLPKV